MERKREREKEREKEKKERNKKWHFVTSVHSADQLRGDKNGRNSPKD